jgi:hypothetical protein
VTKGGTHLVYAGTGKGALHLQGLLARLLMGKSVVAENQPQDAVAAQEKFCVFSPFLREGDSPITGMYHITGRRELVDSFCDGGRVYLKVAGKIHGFDLSSSLQDIS